MDIKTFTDAIRNLIAQGDLAAALQQLQTLLKNSPSFDEAILQSARFQAIQKQIRLGTLSHAEANLTINQISAGLLDLLGELDNQSEKPAIQAELAHAISIVNSKNTVIGSSIHASGDVHIGDKTTHTTTQNAEKIYNIDKIDNADFS